MYPLDPAIPSRSDLDWCWYLRKQGQLGDGLERILHDIGVMTPGGWADWQASTMTDTGAPVEMLFTGHQTSLRLRTEVEDPAIDPTGRVAKVCKIMRDLGTVPPPTALRDVISAAQGAGTLTYGAWLGVCQCDKTLCTTLYAEIPPEAGDVTRLLLADSFAPTIAALGDEVAITMVSYEACNGAVTVHFETPSAPADIVPVLVVPARVSAEPLLGDIGVMLEAGSAFGDPRCELSFSYTTHKNSAVPTLQLEVSSQAMFGTDDVIQGMVRNYPGTPMSSYAGLADQLVAAPFGKSHHGKIGLLACGDACPTLSIGVAAPWWSPFDT